MKKFIFLSGLSLFELIFVVAISLVVAGTGLIYVGRFSGRNDAELAARELRTQLMLARNYAVTYQRPEGWSSQLNYVVTNIGASGDVTIMPNGEIANPYPVKNISISPITLSVSAQPAFSVYTGGSYDTTTSSPRINDISITLTSPVSGRSKIVIVSPNGFIDVRDP